MNNNIVAKIIGSIIAIVVMSFIVIGVYKYYDNEAKNPKKNSNQNEDTPDVVVDNLEFIDYDFKRTDIFLNKNRVIIDVMLTDAGEVIVVNDEAVYYVNSESIAKYAIYDSYLIMDIITDSSENIFLIDENLNIVSTFNSIFEEGNRYVVSKPIVGDITSSIVVNDKIYITYVLDDINDDLPEDTIIQLIYESDLKGTLHLYKLYKYSDYKK